MQVVHRHRRRGDLETKLVENRLVNKPSPVSLGASGGGNKLVVHRVQAGGQRADLGLPIASEAVAREPSEVERVLAEFGDRRSGGQKEEVRTGVRLKGEG